MEYFIREEKFESIEKKINSIKNKCEKLGLPFKFDILGEEIRNIGSERMPVWAKFIKVDVEGRAFIADYEAVAFTVKEHGEYKGYKQTVVTRCKFTMK